MTKQMTKQTVTSDSYNAATDSWDRVTSEIDVLTPEAAAQLHAENDAAFLASCSEGERLEAQLFMSLARAATTIPDDDDVCPGCDEERDTGRRAPYGSHNQSCVHSE